MFQYPSKQDGKNRMTDNLSLSYELRDGELIITLLENYYMGTNEISEVYIPLKELKEELDKIK